MPAPSVYTQHYVATLAVCMPIRMALYIDPQTASNYVAQLPSAILRIPVRTDCAMPPPMVPNGWRAEQRAMTPPTLQLLRTFDVKRWFTSTQFRADLQQKDIDFAWETTTVNV